MRKVITAVLLTVLGFLMMAPLHVCAQETPAADPAKKTATAADADNDQYIIGAEDVLFIFVWREESLTKTVPVRIDGKISLPLVNDIQAAGLTPLQLKDALTKELKKFVDNPTIAVTVMEANSYKVYISGEVKQPGVQRVRSDTTLLKLIITAGGFTEWANKKKILIISTDKGVEKRQTVNYNKILDGDAPDVTIKRGDTVIVR
jgi:polysaccharide export outer membrane protein